jgi:hypothetical protein
LILQAGGAAALSAFLQRALAAESPPFRPGFHRVSGEVTINGRRAAEGEAIVPGDSITTGPGAEAIYVLGDNAFLQRASTKVRFGTEAADFMRVITGRILSVFGPGNKRLTVSTAAIGIRGTACYIEDEGPRTYFCLCYGEAEIVPAAAPQEREVIRTTHHDHPIYINADPAMPKSMVPATVANHSDDELVLLENLVGRVPPFQRDGGGSTY